MTNARSVDDWLAFLRKRFPSGFLFQDPDVSPPDWEFLASSPQPLVLLLNSARISGAIEQLVAAGLGPATPCALLADPILTADAGSIALKSKSKAKGPMLFVFAEDLTPLLSKRLAGKTVLITRAQKQAADLRELLESEGARVLEAPAIEIVEKPERVHELKEALRQRERYAWLVLTSVNTVSILDAALTELGLAWSSLKPPRIACIGTATAACVRELGGVVDLVPPRFQAESLAEELLQQQLSGQRILLPRAEGSRRVLVDALEQNGAEVREIQVYRAQIPEGGHEELRKFLQTETIDFITFTSSSTVHHFVEMAGDLLATLDLHATRIASIGPITAATLDEYGLPVAVEASEFTIAGLVKALVKYA